MLSEIKRNLKLIKYSCQFKLNLVLAGLFFLLSIGIMTVASDTFHCLGIFYFLLATYCILYAFMALSFADCITASPRRRGMEILTTDVIQIIFTLFDYLVMVIICYAKYKTSEFTLPANMSFESSLASEIIIGSILMFILTMYSACVHKLFIPGIIFLIAAMLLTRAMSLYQTVFNLTLSAGIAAGLVIVILGLLLSGIIRRVLYRKAMDPLGAIKLF